MKAKTNLILIVAALAVYWVGLSNASAFYDPGTQRWLNRDPVSEKSGENLYNFIHNNPANSYDLLGLMSWQDVENAFEQRAARIAAANVMCKCDCPDTTYTYTISGGTFGKTAVYADTLWTDSSSPCGPFNSTYYWWDCYSGTAEGDKFNKGWSVGDINYFKAAEPSKFESILGLAGVLGDPDHLDVTSVVIYEQCVQGKLKTKITPASNRLEFDWSILHQKWNGPTSANNPTY